LGLFLRPVNPRPHTPSPGFGVWVARLSCDDIERRGMADAAEAEGLRWVESKLSVQLSPAYLGDVRSGICEQLGGSMLR